MSIVVVTYNSSKTILDTLNSIKHQTYKLSNVELIITDDASTDKTILIVNEWLELNSREFYKVILLDNNENEGVASNINKAWKLCSGKWVKSIAGDDLLFPNCIELNVNFVKNNSNAKIVFSNVKLFTYEIANQLKDLSHDNVFFELSSCQQRDALLYENKLIAPSAFISRQLLIDVGYADEKYCMIEDYPLWLKISKSGERFFLLNEFTVYY
ncbi:glycosyltransferase, partial [Shewanella algae]|uniref:glycosyltransferase n=1 Tax=Shewanella algae TaxID=38313 RepID=UPI0015E80E73